MTTPAPLLSVVTACWNHGQYLGECIASVLGQTEANIEHIIIDDASPDNAREIALAAADADPRVRVSYHEQNRGLAASQNFGIRCARAPWVLKVDADDWVSPEYVEKILAVAALKPAVNVIFSPAHVFGNGKDSVYRYPQFHPARMIDQFMIPGPAAFRRELWARVGGYDETMRSAEDWDFYIRAQLAVGLTPHQLATPLWHYRQHDGQRASAEGMRRVAELKEYWRGHSKANLGTRSWAQWCAEREVAA